MFKLDISPTFFFPVTVEIPQDGKFNKFTFDAELKRLTKEENRAIFERIPFQGREVDHPITDDEILDLVFVGWKGIVDADGSSVPYSETARERVLSIQGVSSAIIAAWLNSISGSKAKN